jgi:hypothetical protein
LTDAYLIWSYEHAAWWRPGRWGYTPELEEAGIYGQAEAEAIVARANVITVNEQVVPAHEAPHFQPVPSLVCPRCRRRSFNHGDIRERYYGSCHRFHAGEFGELTS